MGMNFGSPGPYEVDSHDPLPRKKSGDLLLLVWWVVWIFMANTFAGTGLWISFGGGEFSSPKQIRAGDSCQTRM